MLLKQSQNNIPYSTLYLQYVQKCILSHCTLHEELQEFKSFDMVWLIIINILSLSCMSILHLTSYIVPALCAASPLAVSTVRQFVGTSHCFSFASFSFISMLHTPLSPVIQVTEDVYTGGNSGGGL
jgi:hypothetical protein